MKTKEVIQLSVVFLAASLAVVLGVRYWHARAAGAEGNVYFYDLSEQKLFAAPRDSVPPILGLDRKEADGVRAIVISTNGNPREKRLLKIAYLEKYTPELKAQLDSLRQAEAARKPTAGLIGHGVVPRNTLVRRVTDTQWHLMTSAEGERIVAEWNVPGPDGIYPAVCAP